MDEAVSMSNQFTYISTFLSFVVALALTHLLAGIASALRTNNLRISLRHALWVGIYVFACVDFWFSLWGLRASTDWSLGFVLYLLALVTVLYIGCHLVIPKIEEDAELDLVAFELAKRRKYMAIFAIYISTAIAANLIISGFVSAIWINVAVLALLVCALRWPQARMQNAATAAILALSAYYAVVFIPAL